MIEGGESSKTLESAFLKAVRFVEPLLFELVEFQTLLFRNLTVVVFV